MRAPIGQNGRETSVESDTDPRADQSVEAGDVSDDVRRVNDTQERDVGLHDDWDSRLTHKVPHNLGETNCNAGSDVNHPGKITSNKVEEDVRDVSHIEEVADDVEVTCAENPPPTLSSFTICSPTPVQVHRDPGPGRRC